MRERFFNTLYFFILLVLSLVFVFPVFVYCNSQPEISCTG